MVAGDRVEPDSCEMSSTSPMRAFTSSSHVPSSSAMVPETRWLRGRSGARLITMTIAFGSAPFTLDAPEWLLNPLFVRWFNRLYAWKHGRSLRRRVVSYDRFFYPLDAIADWNRLYGPRGLLQYQCVLPRAAGSRPVSLLLERLAATGAASFLAVIKDCGPASEAYLSFPLEGTTLALDLPYRGEATESLLHELNSIVIEHGGRVYLAKDAVTRPEELVRMVPRLREWQAVRDRWDPARRFRSGLSVRLLGDPV